MYALLDSEGKIKTYPYSFAQLRADNPNTSFPDIPSDALLLSWNVVPVTQTQEPTVQPEQNVAEGEPANTDGVWYQTWVVTDKTQDEINAYNADQKQNRLTVYEQESDPIFFKWQRGEGTQQEWLDKINEIKVRYPYIGEQA